MAIHRGVSQVAGQGGAQVRTIKIYWSARDDQQNETGLTYLRSARITQLIFSSAIFSIAYIVT